MKHNYFTSLFQQSSTAPKNYPFQASQKSLYCRGSRAIFISDDEDLSAARCQEKKTAVIDGVFLGSLRRNKMLFVLQLFHHYFGTTEALRQCFFCFFCHWLKWLRASGPNHTLHNRGTWASVTEGWSLKKTPWHFAFRENQVMHRFTNSQDIIELWFPICWYITLHCRWIIKQSF